MPGTGKKVELDEDNCSESTNIDTDSLLSDTELNL